MSEGPAWALGYDVAELKALARPFKDRYGGLIYGAFGLPKERDIAAALAARRFFRLPDGGLAIANKLKVTGTHRDFTGRAIQIPAGDWMVSDFCPGADVLASVTLLEAELHEASGGFPVPVWIEAFREDEQLMHAFATTQFVPIATKISAGSELKGLHLKTTTMAQRERRLPPPLADEEYFTLQMVQWGFATPSELGDIEGELLEWELRQAKDSEAWAQHYSSYNKRGSWTAFCLRGYAPDPLFVMKPAEMSKTWKAEHPEMLGAIPDWTEASARFRRTLEIVERLPGEKQRIRFMRLAPGDGELSRHADITDRDAGIADGKIVRLHLPIRSHPEVVFAAWTAAGHKIEVNMKPGDLWYLDQRKPHTVKNPSPVERVHLVVDVASSPALRGLFAP